MLRLIRSRRCARLADTLREIETDLNQKREISHVINRIREIHLSYGQADSRALVELSFVCGRLTKIGANRKDAQFLRDTVETVAFSLDLTAVHASDLARFFWSCATVGITPLIPENLIAHMKSQSIPTRELVQLIWAFSKWTRQNDDVKLGLFLDLVNRVNEDHTFSNADITAITRAIALVHSK